MRPRVASDSERGRRRAFSRLGWRSSTVEHLPCKQGVTGSNPVASSARPAAEHEAVSTASLKTRVIPEGCPSGQREQTVNLPALAYGGSNPPPSTDVPLFFGFVCRDDPKNPENTPTRV